MTAGGVMLALALVSSAGAQELGDDEGSRGSKRAEPTETAPAEEAADPSFLSEGTDDTDEMAALLERMRALEAQIDAMREEDRVQAEQMVLDLETKVHGYADTSIRAFAELSRKAVVRDNARDVKLRSVDTTDPHPPGFELGDFIVSYNANLDRRWFAVVDVLLGPDHFGGPIAQVDRLKITFEATNLFHISAGKIQSPFGYWNTNIPYYSFEYATYARPLMLTFERHGALMAMRQTGLDLHGDAEMGFWRWGYHAGVGNGRSGLLARTQDQGDPTWFKATWLQGWLESPGGVQFGFTAVYDPIRPARLTEDFNQDVGDQADYIFLSDDAQDPTLSSNIDEYAIIPHFAWRADRMELLAELALVLHRDDPDASSIVMNRNGYVQWSHQIDKVTPYVRADYVEWWKDDPLYQDLRRLKWELQGTGGLRYDVALHAALKFEATYLQDTVFQHPDDAARFGESPDGIDLQRSRVGGGVTLAAGF